jgi:RNA polymerase sigma-70 factor (ECF subfamily)
VIEIPQSVLEQAASGNMQAFEKVYQAASGFVYNVTLRIVRNSHDAQEVTQDVFMKVYHNLKSFGFRSAFRTWVYRIAVNTAIDRYRQILRQNKGRLDYDAALAEGSCAPGVLKQDNQLDKQAKIGRLLDRLNPEQKTCVLLREIEGLSYKDIAGALKIPVNTVRSRLKRARQAMLQYARGEKGLI